MTDKEKSQTWQVRFYLLGAGSIAVITLIQVWLWTGDWLSGFGVGFGIAGTLAMIFLAAQHWALTLPEVDRNV